MHTPGCVNIFHYAKLQLIYSEDFNGTIIVLKVLWTGRKIYMQFGEDKNQPTGRSLNLGSSNPEGADGKVKSRYMEQAA